MVIAAQRHLGAPTCCTSARRRSPAATRSTRQRRPTSTAADFARVFGPGGLIDTFTNEHLLPYVDTTRPALDAGAPTSASTTTALAAFEQAAAHPRRALPRRQPGPVMTFTLEPKDLSPNAARVTLNLDGQSLAYFNSAARPQPMTWPGKDVTGVITLAFQPVDGSPEVHGHRDRHLGLAADAARGPAAGHRRCPSSSACGSRPRATTPTSSSAPTASTIPSTSDVREVHMPGPLLTAPGFCGKLPAAGDFVGRRLPAAFVRLWDRWVARHLVAAPRRRAAVLCFPLAPAPAGADRRRRCASADRAGRRFPLTLAAPLAGAGRSRLVRRPRRPRRGRRRAATLDADALDARLARPAAPAAGRAEPPRRPRSSGPRAPRRGRPTPSAPEPVLDALLGAATEAG